VTIALKSPRFPLAINTTYNQAARAIYSTGGFSMPDSSRVILDKKIEHYETILVSIGDRATVERLMAMIADLQTLWR